MNKKNVYSYLEKENQNVPAHLQKNYDFIYSSAKTGMKPNFNDIIKKEQSERNKKIEIILNARLKEQKNKERKTQMYFYDEYYSTNSSNLKIVR